MGLQTSEFLPTKSYPFERLRRNLQLVANGTKPGVVGVTDFQVLQREAGANMSVDVLQGDAFVEGKTNTRQGIYHLWNTSRVNVAPFETANATNPRIDQVILVQNDSSVLGASDEPEIKIITGTATAGAALGTPAEMLAHGAKSEASISAEHPNWIRLAWVLIPATATTVTNEHIQDARPASWSTMSAHSVIATEQSRESTSYGTLATPDEVTVYLPENGLVRVAFVGEIKSSVSNAGRAAIFLGSTQQHALGWTIAAPTISTFPTPVVSSPTGLVSESESGASGTTGEALGLPLKGGAAKQEVNGSVVEVAPTFGVIGGVCEMRAPAGIYVVSIQYKASSGSVSGLNRRLYVEVRAF